MGYAKSMNELKEQIGKFFSGDIVTDHLDLESHSHDWSIFKVMPQMVVYPRTARDIKELVSFVEKKKLTKKWSDLSLTVRAAGTDMGGGPLNTSVIVDTTRYMHGIVRISETEVTVLPGTYFRDLEVKLNELGVMLPCYPASKDLCAVGGMVANNGGGEKTLKYGQNKDWVIQLKVVLADGEEYVIEPLSKDKADARALEHNLAGEMYKKMWHMVTRNRDVLENGKPSVEKNSAGYLVWDIWNRETGIFDLTKLFVGAQGTTGIITEITYKLILIPKVSRLMVSFVKTLDALPEFVSRIAPTKPESLEVYDDATFLFAKKFFKDFVKNKGWWGTIMFGLRFVPEIIITAFTGIPKMVVLTEYTGETEKEVSIQMKDACSKLRWVRGIYTRRIRSKEEAEKYWQIRHDSFKLLTEHSMDKSHNSRTAPFIDDIVINPQDLAVFIPRLKKLLDEYKLFYTIAGHIGDGNLHVIPIMDFDEPQTRKTILELMPKVYELIAEFRGSNTGEHNDGIIRTPYLRYMFSTEMLEIFKEIKEMADPLRIFNPGKKVGGTVEDIERFMVS